MTNDPVSTAQAAPAPTVEPTPIVGGWCIKTLPDGSGCIDVLKMFFNYRLVLCRRHPGRAEHPTGYVKGYCYFGHSYDDTGPQRTMHTAMLAAMSAAAVWDGTGDPPGYDKKVL